MPKSTKPRSAAAPAVDAKLKRAKPKAVTYTTEWTDPATGEIHTLSIKHTPKYFDHADHLEVEGARPGRGKTPTPHPLSQTGYLSIFIAPLDLINAGGPVSHIDRLLAEKLASKDFREASRKRAQGDLFAWAESRKAVTKRSPRKDATHQAQIAATPIIPESPADRERRLVKDAKIYVIEWTDPVTRKTNIIFIRHTPKYFDHADRIEIAGEHEINVYRRTPHPLSDTGYLHLLVSPITLTDHRGPVAHVKRRLATALAGVEFREIGAQRVKDAPDDWVRAEKASTKETAGKTAVQPQERPKRKALKKPAP